MSATKSSYFTNPTEAKEFLERWNTKVQTLNNFFYEKIEVETSFGKTVVWGSNTQRTELETLVFFPGARTCALFWDMNNALAGLRKNYRIYIVEVNGQPNVSDGLCPDMKNNELGVWATEIFKKLSIAKASVVTASFGGIVAMKLCLESPSLVDKAVLMATPGIRGFSMSLKNLYYNILPMISPTQKNLDKFLNMAIFHPPHHAVPAAYYKLISEYLLYVLRNHKFKGEYPAPLRKEELNRLKNDIYLILGDKDLLYPPSRTIKIAQKNIASLKDIKLVANTAHGIETSKEAIQIVGSILKN